VHHMYDNAQVDQNLFDPEAAGGFPANHDGGFTASYVTYTNKIHHHIESCARRHAGDNVSASSVIFCQQ